jgi:hypothetical protein
MRSIDNDAKLECEKRGWMGNVSCLCREMNTVC